MGKRRDCSLETRAQVEILVEEGYSQREIAVRLGVSQSCVSRTMKRKSQMGSHQRKQGSGRSRCTTARTDKVIKRMAVKNPFVSASEIHEELSSLSFVPSIRTIQRRLRVDHGLASHKPAKKPLLSKKNIRDRMQFCRQHELWTVDQWKRVLFSDEAAFSQFQTTSSMVRRPPNQRFNKRYTLPVVKFSPKTMVWGAISAAGPGPLHFLPPNTTMNGGMYLTILQQHLQACMPNLGCSIFMNDGAPCHRACSVRNWLRDNHIQVLDKWPGNSPDLNIIENCWNVVKKRVAIHRPKSAAELNERIQQVWDTEITLDYCQHLAASMPKRIAAVIKNRGYPIAY